MHYSHELSFPVLPDHVNIIYNEGLQASNSFAASKSASAYLHTVLACVFKLGGLHFKDRDSLKCLEEE